MKRIYLASASPRRHEILNQMGIAHDILTVPSPDGEDEPRLDAESPEEYVIRTALDKAMRANLWVNTVKLPVRPILTADTTVSLGNDILGKPGSMEEARHMLKQLSGQTHTVQTAVVLFTNGQHYERISTTRVTFATLSDVDITDYVNSSEPWGKAGGYGIQGTAGRFIANINGSYSGVMGLPVFETAQILRHCM